MENSADKWAPKLAQDLLDPRVFGTRATIYRDEGGSYDRVAGERIGGTRTPYTLNASPPIENDQQFSTEDVSHEGSMQAWLAYQDLPFEIEEGMEIEYTWDGKTFLWVVTANRRAVSGFKGAGWRITGDL